jgi:hypothetical protein
MTSACDECDDGHTEFVTGGDVPTLPLLPTRVPAPAPGDGHAPRWVPTNRETLIRVRAALRRL